MSESTWISAEQFITTNYEWRTSGEEGEVYSWWESRATGRSANEAQIAEAYAAECVRSAVAPLQAKIEKWEMIVGYAGVKPVDPGALQGFIQGLWAEKAAAVAQERERQWISVEERLPEINTAASGYEQQVNCIALSSLGVVPAIYKRRAYAKTESGKIPRWEWYGHGLLSGVTHWMPLPKPPAEAIRSASQNSGSTEHRAK